MVEKYIIDKSDIHDLLKGEELPLTQGRARAFQVEVAGHMTNGDVIKALFPKLRFGIEYTYVVCVKLPYHSEHDTGLLFDKDWWNESYGMDERC